MSGRLFTVASCVGAVSAAYSWDEDAPMFPQFADSTAVADFIANVNIANSGFAECAEAWVEVMKDDSTGDVVLSTYCDTVAYGDSSAIAAAITFSNALVYPDSTNSACSTGTLDFSNMKTLLGNFIYSLRESDAICAATDDNNDDDDNNNDSSSFTPSLILGTVAALALRLL